MRRRRRTTAATFAALALTLALTAPQAAAKAPPQCAGSARATRFLDTLTVDGVQRSALVNVPPNPAARRLPLLLAFHGASATGPFMEAYTGLTPLANRHGFIVAYPTANGNLWNSAGAGETDDIVFVRSLLDDLEARLCVDPARVDATGVSNGASFVALLACELSDRLAAVAPVAGGYGVQPPCHPLRPVSLLEIHGTYDWVVPYAGVQGRGAVAAYVAMWGRLDRCAPKPLWRRLAPDVELERRRHCADRTTVAHVKLIGAPHIWPGTTLLLPGEPAGVPFSASEAVVQFFSEHVVTRAALLGRP